MRAAPAVTDRLEAAAPSAARAGGSSSFSDAEAGEFLPSTARRRAMGREEGQPQARAHDGGTRREGRGKKEKTG